MGDVAMTVPVLTALTRTYPNVKITFLTRAFFEPIFEQIPNVSMYAADVKGRHKGVFGLWRLYKELRSLNIDAVADLHNVLRSNILRRYFSFTDIPFEQLDKGRTEKKALTSLKNKKFHGPLKSTHQRYADVFDALGFSLDLAQVMPIQRISLSDFTDNLLSEPAKIKIGIAPFAAFQGKMYPIELMEEVIEELNKNNAYQLLFFGGGKDEIEKLNAFEAKFENGTNCAGKLSFKEELALISNLDVMLAMDSGNGHLAAIYGIPVVTLWGVTHPYAGFYPFNYGKNKSLMADRGAYPLIPTSVYGNKVPKGYERVMEAISPTEIVQSINELLS
ncbi:glycosyltransferase family 9 protein [Aurantibacter crassamenti]|nr:glycosyltransferase family 9 protein [Aurantibacter crassamenti]MBM1105269.1 glycosyltransferase family 9 protein [Aurantibacter crassamenti]